MPYPQVKFYLKTSSSFWPEDGAIGIPPIHGLLVDYFRDQEVDNSGSIAAQNDRLAEALVKAYRKLQKSGETDWTLLWNSRQDSIEHPTLPIWLVGNAAGVIFETRPADGEPVVLATELQATCVCYFVGLSFQ